MFRIKIIIGLLLVNLSLFGQRNSIKSELALADKAILSQNYEEALKHVEAALKIDELYLDALEKKVNIMIIDNRSKEISKEIDEKLSNNLQQPEYYYLRAIVNNYRQKLSKAIEDFDNAIYYQMPVKYLDRVYLNRGVAHHKIGNFELAETDFLSAMEYNPRNATLYHSWGMLNYEQRLFEEAINKFNKAIQYGDKRPILYYNLAMSYLRIDDMDNACMSFGKACSLGYKNACKSFMLECSE